jgi:hypothetical protein
MESACIHEHIGEPCSTVRAHAFLAIDAIMPLSIGNCHISTAFGFRFGIHTT